MLELDDVCLGCEEADMLLCVLCVREIIARVMTGLVEVEMVG
jgi:hypothetical protein